MWRNQHLTFYIVSWFYIVYFCGLTNDFFQTIFRKNTVSIMLLSELFTVVNSHMFYKNLSYHEWFSYLCLLFALIHGQISYIKNILFIYICFILHFLKKYLLSSGLYSLKVVARFIYWSRSSRSFWTNTINFRIYWNITSIKITFFRWWFQINF